MPIRYSCFISYPHGQGTLIKKFVEQLKVELADRIDFYINCPLFLDEDRLKPGYRFNEALSKAICESVCMIVVYMPKYEKNSYCVREFAAMEQIERERLDRLGDRLQTPLGMIIPIIWRCVEQDGQEMLPGWITEGRQYWNVSRYAIGTDNIFANTESVKRLEQIAQSIDTLYRALGTLEQDPCSGCGEFTIPGENVVQDRIVAARWTETPFPGRVGA